MTFRRQVFWALSRGGAMFACGVALAFVTVFLESRDLSPWHSVAAMVTMALMSLGAMIFLGAGVARPFQRWIFLRRGMPGGRLRGFALNQPLLQRWYWVDQSGTDRDE